VEGDQYDEEKGEKQRKYKENEGETGGEGEEKHKETFLFYASSMPAWLNKP
jgi:hypothetical protein